VPGTILEAHASRLVVRAGDGALVIDELQPAGKRKLSAAEFLRGYGLLPGDRLGPK
jgi:methionyl-tRNA formyltransferase